MLSSSSYCLLASTSSVILAEIAFGRMKRISTEIAAHSLVLLDHQYLIKQDSQDGHMIVQLLRLQLASERQQYLSLIHNEEYEEALALAAMKGFDTEVVYKKQIHIHLKQWESYEVDNWIESPSADCSFLFDLLKKTRPSLLLYVFQSARIPSKSTMEEMILFGMNYFMIANENEEERMMFLLTVLKWRIFTKVLFQLEKVDYRFWKVFYS